jgi:benzoate-CoA ligase
MAPEIYNAAVDLLERNLAPARARRTAVIDRDGAYTYADIATRANRFANLLESSGIRHEQRILLALEDTVAFPVCFLGAIKAGVVPMPVNTLLTAEDYAFMLADSRAAAVVASPAQAARIRPYVSHLPTFTTAPGVAGFAELSPLLAGESPHAQAVETSPDDVAFWLYTSGTTGKSKAAMHAHTDLVATAERYGREILAIRADDIVFSAAKLFFAYGLGNALTFPFAVGATAVLHDGPPTPDAVKRLIDTHRPTLFFGVPTLYAMLLNTGAVPAQGHRLRLAVSAGEALPAAILDRWRAAVGIDILDGIGSTEMLHIYMSNRSERVRPGSSGTPVDGYEVALRDEHGAPVREGEIGDLFVRGPSMAVGYWNRRATNRATFQGEWMRTGDKYRLDDGAYVYCGRSDDLLKVGGIYVSPMEVEDALLRHPAVAEAAVVGAEDDDQLIKPKAFVVLKPDVVATEQALIEHVRTTLAPYKRPRWVELVPSLPKTATGKIQRFKLRGGSRGV